MYERASDSAPPISVVGVEAKCASVVESSNREIFERIAFSTIANGRYLFGFSVIRSSFSAPFISTSPFVVPL